MTNNTTAISLKLSGGDISPTNVRMKTLFAVLGGLERAIEAMANSMGIEFDENEAIIVPGNLEESSLGIQGFVTEKANDPLRSIDQAFYADQVALLPAGVRAEFLDMQTTLGRRGISLEMTTANSV